MLAYEFEVFTLCRVADKLAYLCNTRTEIKWQRLDVKSKRD